MKTVITQIGIVVIVVLCLVNISIAGKCEDAEIMIEKALNSAEPPTAMTKEFIQMGLDQCSNNPTFYRLIGDYYYHWYQEEPNVELREEFRSQAITYYRKGTELPDGKETETMKRQLTSLSTSPEFDEARFRSIRPGVRLKMTVYFAFDSAELTDDTQEHLDELGRVMAEIKSIRIKLEGHADHKGTRPYNLRLTDDRAENAKDYLVKNYKIESERIKTAGYGFDRLADPDDPYSSKNRRVEVLKLSE